MLAENLFQHPKLCQPVRYHTDTFDFSLQDQMTFLEADETIPSAGHPDEKTEDFYGGGGQVRKGGKEHFPQLWCANGTYSSYGQASPTVTYNCFF